MPHTWDPDRYLAYADERGRPFLDLIARIDADSPRTVVDLGCGPGNLTGLLAQRWPDADVLGLDSSPEMIAKAQVPGIRFEVGDLREWVSDDGGRVDVLVSNATLQWVPGHLELLPRLVDRVVPGGWLAFQVPGNFDEPSHTIRRDIADDDRAELRRCESSMVKRDQTIARERFNDLHAAFRASAVRMLLPVEHPHQRFRGPHRRAVVVLPDRGNDFAASRRELGLRHARRHHHVPEELEHAVEIFRETCADDGEDVTRDVD